MERERESADNLLRMCFHRFETPDPCCLTLMCPLIPNITPIFRRPISGQPVF